jgi:hypothetical protein
MAANDVPINSALQVTNQRRVMIASLPSGVNGCRRPVPREAICNAQGAGARSGFLLSVDIGFAGWVDLTESREVCGLVKAGKEREMGCGLGARELKFDRLRKLPQQS